jgi:hypothetical protein
MHLVIRQYGDPQPATVSLVAYSEPAKIDGVHFHAGDDFATLNGAGLEEVHQLEAGGVTFQPAGQGSDKSELRMTLAAGTPRPTFAAGSSLDGHVILRDGRSLQIPFKVENARPSLTLISHLDIPAERGSDAGFQIKLSNENDLPVSDALTFSVRSDQPFPRNGAIEIANSDGSLHAKLTLEDAGRESRPSLVLQDAKTLVATLQPLKLFGASAFGPIRFRAVAPDGTAGDWVPLVTLVRLPSITAVTCPKPAEGGEPGQPAESAGSCTLTGSGLYLIESISPAEADSQPVKVPEGFVGTNIDLPPPTGAAYYIRLRDDPAAVSALSLPAGPIQTAAP